jgi:glycosyltransferase involved in cell wall biosynthesis
VAERRIRLLLVISHLVQSGSERFTYEFLKALDRTRFEPALLTKRRRSKRDHYDDLIQDLGVPIIRKLPIFLHYLRRYARPFWLLFRPLIELAHRLLARMRMGSLLDSYDLICPVQIENYYLIQPLIADNERLLVFLMSNAFQYKVNPYLDCKPGRRYRFTIYDPALPDDWAEAPCRGAETIAFPLSMDLRDRPDLSALARIEPPYRIGIFIRLSPERAFSGLFRAFKDVVAAAEAELWVYGRGDPAMFDRELDALGIRHRVFFKGHAKNIESALREAALTCVWSTSFDTTLGYGAIELASFGFPMLFWNLGEAPPTLVLERSGGTMRSYREPAQLAAATLEAFRDAEAFREHGRRLREWVSATYDITRHIERLQDEMEKIAR